MGHNQDRFHSLEYRLLRVLKRLEATGGFPLQNIAMPWIPQSASPAPFVESMARSEAERQIGRSFGTVVMASSPKCFFLVKKCSIF